MKVVLKPGEAITVEFEDSDVSIDVRFDADALRVHTDWPDGTGRIGLLYEEKFVLINPDSKESISEHEHG